jgi:hypothetical protein
VLKKSLGVLATATAMVALTALPASAAPLVDGANIGPLNGVTYTNFTQNYFTIIDANTETSGPIYNEIGQFAWHNATAWSDRLACLNSDLSDAADSTGDQVITCDTQTDIFPGLDSTVGARLYAEGDMVRFTYTLTNTAETAVNYDWWSDNSYAEADKAMTKEEIAAAGYDVNPGEDNDEFVGTAIGLPGSDGYPTEAGFTAAGDSNHTSVEGFGIDYNNAVALGSLAAGESVTIAIFVFHAVPDSIVPFPSAAFSSLNEWAADTFDAFDGRLTRGIAAGVNVANWGTIPAEVVPTPTAEPVATPVLAATGFNTLALTLTAFASLAALLAGLSIAAVRRRTA